MKAIKGGVDKVTHPNVMATNTDKLPGVKGPSDTDEGMDLSGDATNCIGRNYDLGKAESPSARPHSFNQHRGGR